MSEHDAATDHSRQSVEALIVTSSRPRWRRWMKYWLPGLVVLVLIAVVSTCSKDKGKPEYITERVDRQALDLTITATGNLRPTNQVEVGSEVSGRIDRILADVNDRVSRGQVIAQINTDVIEDQIAQAAANLNAARAAVSQAQATLTADTAQLARLQDVYRVSGGKVPSKTELETAQAAVKRGRAAVASAQANVASANAALSSNITNRNRAVIRSPVAGVVLARRVEPGQTVAASFNTPTLFVLAEDLSTMQLRVAIDEADVGQVRQGQSATFLVDAYPGRQFPARVTRVDLASNTTAAATPTNTGGQQSTVVSYEARLEVANPEGLLRPGMTATATVRTGNTGQRLLVPNSALRFSPDAKVEGPAGSALNPQIGLEKQKQQATIGVGSRQQVHVLQGDGTLRKIDVVTGESDGRLTAVRSGALKPGMKVVTGIKAPAQ